MTASLLGSLRVCAAELPVEVVTERWRSVASSPATRHLSQSPSEVQSLIEWADGVASFGSGLSVAASGVGAPLPWLLAGARAWRAEGARVGAFTGLRYDTGTGDWSIDFATSGGLGDSFYGDDLVVLRDVNGDGRDDVLVYSSRPVAGTPFLCAWSLHLSRADGWESEPAWVLGSRVATTLGFGHMASAGDVNRDGFGDVVIGLPHAEDGTGLALLYLGSSEGLAQEPAWVKAGASGGELFGFGVAGIGDVNGDGYDDVFVGAPGHGEENTQRGRGWVFAGRESGLDYEASWTAAGSEDFAWFGAAACARDLDGDGLSDFLVSAPGPATKIQRNLEWPGSIAVLRGHDGGCTAIRGLSWTG